MAYIHNMARTESPPLQHLDPELKDMLVEYEIHHAQDRQTRDKLVETWRRKLEEAVNEVAINWKLFHDVLICMDEFLIRSKK